MKKLEVLQMENLQGGVDCFTGLGISVGLILGGALLTSTAFGAGVGMYMVGAGSLMLSGGNCAGAFN